MTSIRITVEPTTYAVLKSIAEETGEPIQRVVKLAIEGYRRDRFLEGLNRDFQSLKRNCSEWQVETEGRTVWDCIISD